MNGKKSRVGDTVSTVLAAAFLGAACFGIVWLAGGPRWACWMTAVLVYFQAVATIRLVDAVKEALS